MPQATDARTQRLEDVAAKARFYLEKHREFLEREKEEGRELQHWISPRVHYACRDLMLALDQLDEEGDQDSV